MQFWVLSFEFKSLQNARFLHFNIFVLHGLEKPDGTDDPWCHALYVIKVKTGIKRSAKYVDKVKQLDQDRCSLKCSWVSYG